MLRIQCRFLANGVGYLSTRHHTYTDSGLGLDLNPEVKFLPAFFNIVPQF